MTRRPSLAAPVTVTVLALFTACAEPPLLPPAAVEQRVFEVDFAVPPPERLEIRLYRGHVLVSDAPAPRCEVLARVHGADAEEAAARARSIGLEANLEGTVQHVRLGHARGAPLDAVDVRFDVGVPEYMAVAIESHAARVSLRGCVCDVDVSTECGDIRARPAGGVCNLATMTGAIELAGNYERAVLSTATGDIEVVLPDRRDGVTVEVTSESGRITIAVPDGCKVDLVHETEHGRLRTDFSVRVDRDDERSTRALLGNPDSPRTAHLIVHSKSSLVEVRRQGNGSSPPGH